MKKQIIYFFCILLFSFINKSYSQNPDNYVARFNGYYNYVSLENNPLYDATAYTLEAWVNPFEILNSTMSVIGKNFQTGYFLGIQSSGRIVFYPKGSNSLRSRVTGIIPARQWTHIAVTYTGSVTSIYINGNLDTSTTAISGPLTLSSDSVRIGADRVGSDNLFFYGYMDNVRFWKSARTAAEIREDRFIPFSMYDPSGKYISLRASFLFNNNVYNSGGSAIGGWERNISYINYSNKAVNICDYNNSLVLNGTTDYCAHEYDAGRLDMPGDFTLEAWIKRDTTGTQALYQNIITKSGGTNGFDFGMYIGSNGDLYFAINKFAHFTSAPGVVQTSQWTHIAASYSPSIGKAVLYCNGDSVGGTTFEGNPEVESNPYMLYFGASGASISSANKFKGQMDDIKLWFTSVRTQKEIKENMFCNNIFDIGSAGIVAYFTFDKYQNGFHYGGSSHIGGLKYFGNATIRSAHSNLNNLSSPVIYDRLGEFNSSSSVMTKKSFFVPDANITGVTDSIYISEGSPVNNLRVCVLMSHSFTGDINLILTAPSGSSIYLLEANGAGGNDVMTIFSDAADSSASFGINVNGPGINSPFSPTIKANQPLSVFNGQNRKGWWKLKVVDNISSDIGYVHGWGLNFRPEKKLILSAFIQGFYNSASNKMKKDTAKILLRNALPPYTVADSSKSLLDSNGKSNFYFNKVVNGTNYYLVFNHRNSIQTWSASVVKFTADTLAYNFTSAVSKAYGNNLIQVDLSPVRFAVYGGDINQSGNVDATDLSLVENDAIDFITGYVKTDVNGDNVVDAIDLSIIDFNAFNFVSKMTPP